jgi:hypothetical protein
MRNALAAANIWSPLSVRTTKIRQIFNLAIPANEFVNLAELMTGGDIEDSRDILLDGPRRDAFHEFHWLPTRQGALLKTLPVHDPNDLYDTTFRLFTLQSPFLMGKTQRAIALLSDQRFVDLNTNLHYLEKRYDTILAQPTNSAIRWPVFVGRHFAESRSCTTTIFIHSAPMFSICWMISRRCLRFRNSSRTNRP